MRGWRLAAIAAQLWMTPFRVTFFAAPFFGILRPALEVLSNSGVDAYLSPFSATAVKQNASKISDRSVRTVYMRNASNLIENYLDDALARLRRQPPHRWLTTKPTQFDACERGTWLRRGNSKFEVLE